MTATKLGLEILKENRESFVEAISQYYPLSDLFMEKYAHLLDWKSVSKNREIKWDNRLLEKFKGNLIWKGGLTLSANPSLPWSVELVKTHIIKHWEWDDLMWQEKVFSDPALLALCLPEWHTNARQYLKNSNRSKSDLGMYKYFQHTKWSEDAIEWAPEVVENTGDKLHWDLFSGITGFPWTAEFIEKHQDKLDWHRLSWNGGLPWSLEFIKQFEAKWDWGWMSYKIPWTLSMIDAFKDRLRWYSISNEDKIPFLDELIKKYPDRVEWAVPDFDHGHWEGTFDGIINSEQLIWTPELFEQVRVQVDAFFKKMIEKEDGLPEEIEGRYWTYFCETNNWTVAFLEHLLDMEKTQGITAIDWSEVCGGFRRWTPSFVELHKEKLLENIDCLCSNRHFPWDQFWDVFKSHLSQYSVGYLSRNPAFPISESFIEKHKGKQFWYDLSSRSDLSTEILEKYGNELDWVHISRSDSYSFEFLQQFPDHVKWRSLSRRNDLKIDKMDLSQPWNWASIFNSQADLKITDHIDEALVVAFFESIKSQIIP